jgi:23S rRNA (adenine2030-N6)-methyltransferase
MQYRHAFHAGNFADVHKHVALLALLGQLKKKSKGFLYLDTHSAGGLFDLHGEEAARGAEWRDGIGRLAGSEPAAPELREYLDAVRRLRALPGVSSHDYPGSPLLAAQSLRDVDRAVFVESRAQEARALDRALARLPPAAKLRVETGDGYASIKALLPPVERRGLTLVDPPFEDADEFALALDALAAGLARFDTGVFVLWFPVKRQRDCDLFLARVARSLSRPTLALLLWMHARDTAVGLNGSGLLVVNPPWQTDTAATRWQEELRSLLGGGPASGSEVTWVIHEQR